MQPLFASDHDGRALVLNHKPADVPEADVPMCMTPEAVRELLATVGAEMPETGGKGFGPWDRFGVDVFEQDKRGSAHASGGVYSPDVEWGDARADYWLNQPEERRRVWTLDAHSHPGGMGRLSAKVGKGLGDLGYVESVFEENEAMQYFGTPLLTNTAGSGPVAISPWIHRRDAVGRPMWAELRICSVEQFPTRIFNPEWIHRIEPEEAPAELEPVIAAGDTRSAALPDAALAMLELIAPRLQDMLDASVLDLRPAKLGGWLVELETFGQYISVQVPEAFPAEGPTVGFRRSASPRDSLVLRCTPTGDADAIRLVRYGILYAGSTLLRHRAELIALMEKRGRR